MQNKIFIWLAFIVLPSVLVAQKPGITNFQHHNKFPVSTINHITQGPYGYLWIATPKGLFRYDGHSFESYGKQNGIKQAHITALFVANDSSLYITAVNGHTWRKKGNQIEHIKANGNWPLSAKAPVKDSYLQINDTVTFCTYDFKKYTYCRDSLLSYQQKKYAHIIYMLVKKIKYDWRSRLALYLRINFERLINTPEYQPEFFSVSGGEHQGTVFIGNLKVCINQDSIWHTFINAHPADYVQTDGVSLTGTCNKGLIIEKSNGYKDTLLKNHFITDLYADRNKGIWIGTAFNGLFYMRNVHTLNFFADGSETNHFITDIVRRQNTIIAAFSSGKIAAYMPSENRFRQIFNVDFPILHLLKTGKNELMVTGLYKRAVLNFEHKKPKLIDLLNNPAKINKKFAVSSNRLATLGTNGVFACNLYNNRNKTIHLKNHRLEHLAIHQGKIYTGNRQGLWVISPGKNALKIHSNPLTYLGAQDSLLFTGTGNGVLTIQSSQTDTLQQFTGYNHINHVFYNGKKYLISTPSGTYVGDNTPKKKNHLKYNCADGLQSAFVQKSIFFNDTLYLLYQKGLGIIPANKKQARRNFPLQLKNPYNKRKNNNFYLRTNYGQNDVKLAFSTFNYCTQHQEPIYYSIAGDTTVHKTDAGTIYLACIPRGTTIIKVGHTKKLQPESNVTKVIIENPYKWYQYPGVKLIILLLILLIIIMVVSFRIKSIKKKNALQNTQIAQMQTVLQQQMNPHFIFNSLTSINHFILQKDPMASSRYLTKFSTLIRNILDNSEKQFISLADELESLRHYLDLELLRFKNRFTYHIKVEPGIDQNRLMIPPFILQPFVERALRDGIINKPEKGHILVRLSYAQKKVQCQIIDNGISRKELKKINTNSRAQIGTQIAQQRMDLYNKLRRDKIIYDTHDMVNHKGEATGTKVILIFPINYK